MDKLESVGRPAEGVDVRLVDSSGREVPPGEIGEVGEIVGRAESMMIGYLGRDDLTEALTWRDREGRAFFRTGDLGRFDEDGFLYVVGRLKDVILSGAQNVHPEDLERVLTEHEAVAEAAVVGVPDDTWGETPWGFVVLRPGHETDAQTLRAWANARLGRRQRLAGLEIRASLPRNAAGKVLKRKLARSP
jgi:acyl-CoA synthetase (AMP-forming)/AMP-acid ligase II